MFWAFPFYSSSKHFILYQQIIAWWTIYRIWFWGCNDWILEVIEHGSISLWHSYLNGLSTDSFTQQGIVSQGTTLIGAVAGERRSEVHFPGFSFYFLWLFSKEEVLGCVYFLHNSHFQKDKREVKYLVAEGFIIPYSWWWTRFRFEVWFFIIHLATPLMKVSLDEEFF